MSGDRIRHLLAADPFEPFALGMASRSVVDVTRPELAEVTPGGDALILKGPDGQLRQAISLRHVCTVTFPDRPTIR